MALVLGAEPASATPPLTFRLSASAAEYPPSEKIDLQLSITLDASARVIPRNVGPHMVDVYPLTVPGEYTIRLAYRHSGASGGRTDVFTGTLLSNRIAFRLVR